MAGSPGEKQKNEHPGNVAGSHVVPVSPSVCSEEQWKSVAASGIGASLYGTSLTDCIFLVVRSRSLSLVSTTPFYIAHLSDVRTSHPTFMKRRAGNRMIIQSRVPTLIVIFKVISRRLIRLATPLSLATIARSRAKGQISIDYDDSRHDFVIKAVPDLVSMTFSYYTRRKRSLAEFIYLLNHEEIYRLGFLV